MICCIIESVMEDDPSGRRKSDILRIYAEPFAYNTASCRVLEKAGFQYEGTLRNNAVKNGKVIDMKMYSLLKEEV